MDPQALVTNGGGVGLLHLVVTSSLVVPLLLPTLGHLPACTVATWSSLLLLQVMAPASTAVAPGITSLTPVAYSTPGWLTLCTSGLQWTPTRTVSDGSLSASASCPLTCKWDICCLTGTGLSNNTSLPGSRPG